MLEPISSNLDKQSFLADVHIAVVSIPVENRGPLTVPIWYSYTPGGKIVFVTFEDSWKAKLLKAGKRISLCVHNENPPYRFVTVEGPVVGIRQADFDRDIVPLVSRYLERDDAGAYIAETYPDPNHTGELLIEMAPERWYSS